MSYLNGKLKRFNTFLWRDDCEIKFKYMDYSSNNSSGLRLILCRGTVSLDYVSDTNTIVYFKGYDNNQNVVIPMALN